MKKLLILLIITLLPLNFAEAQTYDKYAYTPEHGMELVSYVALNEDNYVYNNLRYLTLMGIFRQERDFSLANYVTLPDALRLLFRCAGLEDYAYECGENLELRASLGIDPSIPCNPHDGPFIAAYLKGLISHERLMAYFANEPGSGIMHYAVRGEIVVWLCKLFGIAPSYDYTVLNKYGSDVSLIAPSYKPYFAGAMNTGSGIVTDGKYKPCSLLKNGDLVMLITRFYPYLLKTNGIETATVDLADVTVDENGVLTVNTSSNITLKATTENSCPVVGSSYLDNLYMFLAPEAKSKRIVCYIKNGTVIFVSTTMNPPAITHTEEKEATLYFYDNSTGAAVFTTPNEDFMYFLDSKAQIIINGQQASADSLMDYLDFTFKIHLNSVNSYSLKKIIKLETGGENS